jgi:cysteine sulfinate desulfinase/cysteine desulfurase-like protein
MGVDEQRASTSLRFGLSRFTTGQEVVAAADQIGASVMRVRERSRRVMAQ